MATGGQDIVEGKKEIKSTRDVKNCEWEMCVRERERKQKTVWKKKKHERERENLAAEQRKSDSGVGTPWIEQLNTDAS